MTADDLPAQAAGRVEFSEFEATEAGLSVLARKLRAEMALALLESFVRGERSGRSMLAEFEHIQEQFRAGLSDDDGGSSAPAGSDHGPQAPEWERLRLQAGDRGSPIALWEVFHGLDQLAQRNREGALQNVSVDDVERAMDLSGSMGETWSLHDEVKAAKTKLGEQHAPADAGTLAGMLQRVDAARTLLKQGHFEVGIRPMPQTHAPTQVMSEAMMRRMEAQIDPVTTRQMTKQAALGLVQRGAHTPELRTDVSRAMRAGESRALAERAQNAAHAARTRATELRSGRLSARSTLIWAATADSGVAITGASLAGQTSLALQTTIGLSLTALGATANLMKDWRTNRETLWAPYKAFGAEKFANMATRLADRDRHDLDQNTPLNVLRRARDVSRSAQLGFARRAVKRLDRAPDASSTSGTSNGASREQSDRGQGQSM
ncbi:hypothetical protein AD006_31530 (plasmid) [Pseudonocardia sp. EC080610-09]|uniref:hypothetical protein n=1 Tax=unclassified Pseudonocardia TaxID=2619320 RepID=UPI0007060C71|nr:MULTISPECIES: hypothetical protein [unclassified Pseudonocardia]ALL79690.1 hypothetical protein AD006_31530 [Pseudonocardia sp. EC080610-09]ALL85356.1 hypothetical protein AD017_29720 [Pseudonocardia sp. EC080619-01]